MNLGYSVTFDPVSVSAAVDLLEGLTAAGRPAKINRVKMASNYTSLEQLRWALLIRTSAGTGGSAATPRPLNPNNTTSPVTTFNRTVTTPGTAGNIWDQGYWGQVYEFDMVLGKPSLEIEIPASTRFALALLTAPGAARTMNGTIYFEE